MPRVSRKLNLPDGRSFRVESMSTSHGEILIRPGTNDENIVNEVLVKRGYRKPKIGFGVFPGEKWLDLGAHIGSFARFCSANGAVAECYEPDPTAFAMLRANVDGLGHTIHNMAVTGEEGPIVTMWPNEKKIKGRDLRVMSRMGPLPLIKRQSLVVVPNRFLGALEGPWDGAKLDIEGTEFSLMDNGLLEILDCRKLVLEYHFSLDRNSVRLARRLAYLKRVFKLVDYPPELDVIIAENTNRKPFSDRLIFCMDKR